MRPRIILDLKGLVMHSYYANQDPEPITLPDGSNVNRAAHAVSPSEKAQGSIEERVLSCPIPPFGDPLPRAPRRFAEMGGGSQRDPTRSSVGVAHSPH